MMFEGEKAPADPASEDLHAHIASNAIHLPSGSRCSAVKDIWGGRGKGPPKRFSRVGGGETASKGFGLAPPLAKHLSLGLIIGN